MTYIDTHSEEREALLAKIEPLLAKHSGDPTKSRWLTDYYMVSLHEKPFDDTLGTPSRRLWPFWVEGKLSDERIVAIVDFTREYFAAMDKPRSARHSRAAGNGPILTRPAKPSLAARNEPILSITVGKAGKIEVMTGTLQGPLSGSGLVLILVPKGGTFVVLSEAYWVS